MDVLTKEQRHRNMAAIKSKGTKAEVILSKALWRKGYRYRKNDSKIYGKPDLVLKKYRLVIFIDSEYFHGKDWELNKHKIKSNRSFWWKKLETNIRRDKLVTNYLEELGWSVIRFWSKDIEKNLDYCIELVDNLTCRLTK